MSEAAGRIVLHACCAPCSAAVVEWLLANGCEPVVFFSNANIFPHDEYALRLSELKRFLQGQGVPYVDDAWDHDGWLRHVHGLEGEPERGRRCQACFAFRLRRAAEFAAGEGIPLLATTLAASRWKSVDQVNAAGRWAAAQVTGVEFWERNWRKGGLQERRAQLLKEHHFYNQQWCGCEFSQRSPLPGGEASPHAG